MSLIVSGWSNCLGPSGCLERESESETQEISHRVLKETRS